MNVKNEYCLVIGCDSTNKKTRVFEVDNFLLFRSYETFISIYDINRKTLINNLDYYKVSNTTRTHYYSFVNHINFELPNIKDIENEVFLTDNQFYRLIDTLKDNLNIDNQLADIYKEYSLEKSLIESLENYNYNLNENYKCNIGSWNTVDYSKKELKTRNKEIYLVELSHNYVKPQVEVTITTNKKRTKILNVKVKIISKYGLSFNNYNTKELDKYTNYYCY